MSGLALEDVPIPGGYAVHWEARLMGPELMSYGTGTGETYISDVTLAFLEDTSTRDVWLLILWRGCGVYVVNDAMAMR